MAAGGARRRPPGRHLLTTDAAQRFVAATPVEAGDLVVDLGAGTGQVTAPLLARGARVVAVELDAGSVVAARRRFEAVSAVTLITADARTVALPHQPFRIVANLPFSGTTAILRHVLDQPRQPLRSVDVIVEWGAALGFTANDRSTPWTALWAAYYELHIVRRYHRGCFHPQPRVDAAHLAVRRRPQSLIPAAASRDYARFVAACFDRPATPLRFAARKWCTDRQVVAAIRGIAHRNVTAAELSPLVLTDLYLRALSSRPRRAVGR